MEHIDIQRPFAVFNHHFNIPDNNRILFSAPFGTGKTYFLKNFFNQYTEEGKVNQFWLSPIKYIVSQNEDIFEYIKFDIARQILEHPKIKKQIEVKYGESQYLYQYIINKPKDILKLLFSVIEETPDEVDMLKPGIGTAIKGAGKIGGKLIDGVEKYNEFKSAIDKHLKSFNSVLSDYLNTSIVQKGSIYEDDFISQVIRQALKFIKGDKDNVLIIDDLDRLDPDHIFRILNILSVHHDYTDGANKFGFDKILIVCDLRNIRGIYEHKFGIGDAFDGYIEKFFSTNVFEFTNELAIANFCDNIQGSSLDEDSKKVLGIFLSFFVSSKLINIRSIVKHSISVEPFNFWIKTGRLRSYGHSNKVQSPVVRSYRQMDYHIDSADFSFLKVIKVLIIIFGSAETLKRKLKIALEGQSFGTKDALLSVCKVMGPFYLLSKNYDNSEALTISTQLPEGGYPADTYYFDPYVDIFSTRVFLSLKWSEENPYESTKSLYENNNDIVSVKVFNKINGDDKANKVDLKQMLYLLKDSLNFLDNRGFLDRLG